MLNEYKECNCWKILGINRENLSCLKTNRTGSRGYLKLKDEAARTLGNRKRSCQEKDDRYDGQSFASKEKRESFQASHHHRLFHAFSPPSPERWRFLFPMKRARDLDGWHLPALGRQAISMQRGFVCCQTGAFSNGWLVTFDIWSSPSF